MMLEEHLPPEIRNHSKSQQAEALGDFKLPNDGLKLDTVERDFILQALKITGGNQTRAAAMLGISRHTLRYGMDKYRLSHERN